MDLILKYFPNLTGQQKEQFAALFPLYSEWNAKINVISRKDIDNLYVHHVLHSLAIAKLIQFVDGTCIMDVGTGGGFPGIPLAIMFPDCRFTLVDSIGKKIKVAGGVADAIGLSNVEFKHCRAEEEKRQFDFIVSRAVMTLPDMVKIVRKNVGKECKNALPNGLICLKGGNLDSELKPFKKNAEADDLSMFFDEDYFDTKKIVYVMMS